MPSFCQAETEHFFPFLDIRHNNYKILSADMAGSLPAPAWESARACRLALRHSGNLPIFIDATGASSYSNLLQSLKVMDDVAPGEHSYEVISQHDWHLIHPIPAHFFERRRELCVRRGGN
jgi:hypothetical protein